MSTKTKSPVKNRASCSPSETVLLIICVLLILPGLLIYGWYGMTRISVTQRSSIREQTVPIQSGGITCTLAIPAGTLTIRHPQRAALGSSYDFTADVQLDSALRLTDCSGSLPNWSIYLEGQTTLVASGVQPYAVIRQPAVNREQLRYAWTYTPEEAVPVYQSHLYLRAVVMEQDQTIERWNLLVRDFPMENIALFGQPTILWLVSGGVSILIGVLLLIILRQKRSGKKAKNS